MTLDARIVDALTRPCTPDDVQAILAAADAKFATLEAQADALDVEALSPLLTMEEAVAKHSTANDLRFESDRLDASVSALRARIADLREAEAQAVRRAERDAALAERDELAGDVAENYPRLVRELTGLAARIEASDARCKAIGIIESAEAIGRGVPASFYIERRGTVQRIATASLPMPTDVYPAWCRDTIAGPVVYRGLDA